VLHVSGDGGRKHGSSPGNVNCKTEPPPKKEIRYAKRLDVVGNYIISVKAVEKCVGCFYGLVVFYTFFSLHL